MEPMFYNVATGSPNDKVDGTPTRIIDRQLSVYHWRGILVEKSLKTYSSSQSFVWLFPLPLSLFSLSPILHFLVQLLAPYVLPSTSILYLCRLPCPAPLAFNRPQHQFMAPGMPASAFGLRMTKLKVSSRCRQPFRHGIFH